MFISFSTTGARDTVIPQLEAKSLHCGNPCKRALFDALIRELLNHAAKDDVIINFSMSLNYTEKNHAP